MPALSTPHSAKGERPPSWANALTPGLYPERSDTLLPSMSTRRHGLEQPALAMIASVMPVHDHRRMRQRIDLQHLVTSPHAFQPSHGPLGLGTGHVHTPAKCTHHAPPASIAKKAINRLSHPSDTDTAHAPCVTQRQQGVQSD